MRIASLLASGTEVVCALGLEDGLVAISHECDYPPEVVSRTRVTRARFEPEGMTSRQIDEALRRTIRERGAAYSIDRTGLGAARPDLVLTQGVCEVCAVSTPLAESAVASMDPKPTILSLDSHRIDDILDSFRAIGTAAGVPARASALVEQARRRLTRVVERVRGARRPTVLAVEWLDPVFVPGHWVPEMFDIAGGDLLYGRPGERSRQLSWDDFEGADPDVVVIMPCGLDLEATMAQAGEHGGRIRRCASRALAAGTVFAVDGSAYFSRSGPRFVTGIEVLSALFHPERCGHYRFDGAAARWPGPA